MQTLEQLHAARFAALPLRCGRLEPGVLDSDEWRDWSEADTTPDQRRIEDYLDRFDLAGKRMLHIGSGNSSLARRFHARAALIVGTTVVPEEAALGNGLGLPRYRVLLHNKYGGAEGIEGPFDFIVDNNPTTFCCCLEHLEAMLTLYAQLLAPGGQVVTDRVGLSWSLEPTTSSERWGFAPEDLAEVASRAGLALFPFGKQTLILARAKPRSPSRLSYLAQVLRKVRRRLGLAA